MLAVDGTSCITAPPGLLVLYVPHYLNTEMSWLDMVRHDFL